MEKLERHWYFHLKEEGIQDQRQWSEMLGFLQPINDSSALEPCDREFQYNDLFY